MSLSGSVTLGAPNVETIRTRQKEDPASLLNFWRKRLQIRKTYPEVLVNGRFEAVQATMNDGPAFAYWRLPQGGVPKVQGLSVAGARDVLVVMNLSARDDVDYDMPIPSDGMSKRFLVLDSTAELAMRVSGLVASGEQVTLKAFQAVVFGY